MVAFVQYANITQRILRVVPFTIFDARAIGEKPEIYYHVQHRCKPTEGTYMKCTVRLALCGLEGRDIRCNFPILLCCQEQYTWPFSSRAFVSSRCQFREIFVAFVWTPIRYPWYYTVYVDILYVSILSPVSATKSETKLVLLCIKLTPQELRSSAKWIYYRTFGSNWVMFSSAEEKGNELQFIEVLYNWRMFHCNGQFSVEL